MLNRFDQLCMQFRSQLTSADVAQLRSARSWFLASQVPRYCMLCSLLTLYAVQFVPPVLYYLGTSETQTKFPATISFTIRKGIPKWAQHLIWLRGWACTYSVLSKKGKIITTFSKQMIVTGIIATWMFPVGKSAAVDKVHFVTSALYMLDHICLLQLLGVKSIYKLGFYASFLLMAIALYFRKKVEQLAELPSEGDVDNSRLEALREQQLDKPAQRKLFWLEGAVMLFENSLFFSFVTGMTSGIETHR